MIAVDTSSLIAFLQGETGADCDKIDAAMQNSTLMLPPPVISELLSKPQADQMDYLLSRTPTMELSEGYWERVGRTRRGLLSRRLKAALANCLVAQCCIDADVPLITRDGDYRHFATHCGLKLA